MHNNYFKNGLIYLIFNIFQKGISLIMVPIYTSYISPEKLGIFSAIQSLGALFIVLFTFGLDEAAALFYFKNCKSPRNLKNTIGNIITISMIIGGIGSFSLYIYQNEIYYNIIPTLPKYFVVLSISIVFFSPFYNIYQKILRIQSKAIYHALLISGYSFLQLFFIVLFILIFNKGVLGLLISFSLTAIIFGIFSLIKIISLSSLNFKKTTTKRILNYSKNITIHALCSWGITNLMIVTLGKLSNTSEVGIYTAISFFSLILIELSKTFINIFQPFLFENIQNPKNRIIVLNIINIVILIILLFAFFLIIFSQYIFVLFFNYKYHTGIVFIPLVIIVGLSNFYSLMIDQIFNFFEKSSKFLSYASVSGFILNLILIVVFRDDINIKTSLLILITVNITILFIKLVFLSNKLEFSFDLFPLFLKYFVPTTIIVLIPFWAFPFYTNLFFFFIITSLILIIERERFSLLIKFLPWFNKKSGDISN